MTVVLSSRRFGFVMTSLLSIHRLQADRSLSRLLSSFSGSQFLAQQRSSSARHRQLRHVSFSRLSPPIRRATHAPRAFSTRHDSRGFHFWLSMRGGTIQGPDPGTIDQSIDRKPLPLLLNEYQVSVCSVKGLRSFMEDEFVSTGDFCAVFDGHGGDAVARFLRQNLYAFMQAALPSKLAGIDFPTMQTNGSTSNLPLTSAVGRDITKDSDSARYAHSTLPKTDETDFDSVQANWKPSVEDYVLATQSALEAVDAKVQRILHWSYQGSTATGIWLHDDGNGTRHVITGHVGDSRAVLSRCGGSQIIELSRDHKPDLDGERARIESVGGSVIWCGRVDREGRPITGTGLYRVNGNLALSRAIGDRSERPAVTARPDISVQPLSPDDDFLVIATDGLWDVMTTLDVVGFIQALIEEDDGELMADRDLVAAKLVEESLRRGTYDNVTVIIVWLDALSIGSS